MDLVSEQKDIQWISHRGYHQSSMENSQEAFDAAVKLGFTCLETDLRITKDQKIVLCHDETLTRLGGPDAKVSDMMVAELKSVQLDGGGRLMFFEDFMERYKEISWVFDIKRESASAVIAVMKTWMQDHGMQQLLDQRASFLFWTLEHEQAMRASLPNSRYFAQKPECWRAGLANLCGLPSCAGLTLGRYYAVPPMLAGLSTFKRSLFKRYQKRGSGVIAYLPETEEQVEQAIAGGADIVLTNHKVARIH